MGGNKKPLELTDRELMKALRCCAKSEAAACRKCPMGISTDGEKCCFDALRLMTAERIGALVEENRRLMDATEGLVKELTERMATLARESNTARERGLQKASGDYVLALNEIQAKLEELGRASVVGAEPVEGEGWRVTLIVVDGTEVFKAEGGADAENG